VKGKTTCHSKTTYKKTRNLELGYKPFFYELIPSCPKMNMKHIWCHQFLCPLIKNVQIFKYWSGAAIPLMFIYNIHYCKTKISSLFMLKWTLQIRCILGPSKVHSLFWNDMETSIYGSTLCNWCLPIGLRLVHWGI
jgi:hypothetical protein